MTTTPWRRILLLLAIALPAGCASTTNREPSGHAPVVRVQVLAAQEQVMVSATAAPAVRSSGESGWRRINFPSGGGVPVTFSPGGWTVGNVTFPAGELFIQPQPVGSVSVNGLSYRGRYRFVPTSGGRFDVINDLDVDSYLMGVVAKEVIPTWDIQAYKAQAIAARTYALYEVKTSTTGQHFDLFDDERSQVYGGMAGENDKSRQAVHETAGAVVAFGPRGQEKIFKAYFSSCCGGAGQSVMTAFGETEIQPLTARHVGALCAAATRYNWNVSLPKTEVARRMKLWAVRSGKNHPIKDVGPIASIDVAQVNNVGRPIRFVITDIGGRRYSLGSEEFRWACNADASGGPTLFSSYVKPISVGDAIQFTEGHGWGHGVGMCQWCAQSLALKGQSHEQILLFSYPGAVLVRAY